MGMVRRTGASGAFEGDVACCVHQHILDALCSSFNIYFNHKIVRERIINLEKIINWRMSANILYDSPRPSLRGGLTGKLKPKRAPSLMARKSSESVTVLHSWTGITMQPVNQRTRPSISLTCRSGPNHTQTQGQRGWHGKPSGQQEQTLQANVSVSPPSNIFSAKLQVRPTSWAFAAGLIAISVAALSLGRILLQASREASKPAEHPAEPLTRTEEETLASVAPMLLAAETAAGIDETELMTLDELNTLDLNLRMLITQMDAQLAELQEALLQRLPSTALQRLDSVTKKIQDAENRLAEAAQGSSEAAELENILTDLQWEYFQIVQPTAGETAKRSYRSILYNRNVQSRLLRQVERQILLRTRVQHAQEVAVLKGNEQPASVGGDASISTAPVEEQEESVKVEKVPEMYIAAASTPHPKKAETGGEDAYFVSMENQAFGIADGVGGWAAEGIDPSEYPRRLIEACKHFAAKFSDPMVVLQQGYVEAHAPGSCTIALACLQDHILRVASLGDCETMVLRDGHVLFQSQIQEHKFNQPFQLASPRFLVGDVPGDAAVYRIAVQPGDVIIMGSDGLWDNVWSHEIENLLRELGLDSVVENPQGVLERAAKALMELASSHSRDNEYSSPFAIEKHERLVHPLLRGVIARPCGGKLDDITVVIAYVQ